MSKNDLNNLIASGFTFNDEEGQGQNFSVFSIDSLLKKDERNFSQIIRDWQLLTNTNDSKSFLEQTLLQEAITPENFNNIFSTDRTNPKALDKELVFYLSTLVPLEVCSQRMFRSKGIKEYSQAEEKNIISPDPVKFVDAKVKRLSQILNENPSKPLVGFSIKERLVDTKYRNFLEGFYELVDNWLESKNKNDFSVDMDVVIKHTIEQLGITKKQFMGKDKLPPEKANEVASLFASIFSQKNLKDQESIDNYEAIYTLAFSLWSEKEISDDKDNAFGKALKFLRVSKGKAQQSFDEVYKGAISQKETGKTDMLIHTLDRFFTGLNLSHAKPAEAEDSEFDKITKVIKDAFPPYTVGIGYTNRDSIIVLRALQQKDLAKGLATIKSDGGKNTLGNTLRYVRTYKAKFITDFEQFGIDKRNLSAAELGKEEPFLKSLNRIFKGFNLSHKKIANKESEFDIVTNFLKDILPSYKKKSDKSFNTRETITILRALQCGNISDGLNLLDMESENIVADTLKFLRTHKDKTLYDFPEIEATNLTRIELGKVKAEIESLRAIINGLNLSREKTFEQEDNEFDLVTTFLKDKLPHFKKGVSDYTKEEMIILRALCQENLGKALELIENESFDNTIGNTTKFLRIYKGIKGKNVGELEQSALSQKELGVSNHSPKSFRDFITGLNLSTNEFSTIMDFFNKLLSSSQETKGFTREDFVISRALLTKDLTKGMDLIAQEIKQNILGSTLRFLRLYKDVKSSEFENLTYKEISAKESGQESPTGNFLKNYFNGLKLENEELKIILAKLDEHILVLQPRKKLFYEKRSEKELYVEGTWQKLLNDRDLSNSVKKSERIL